MKQYTAMIVVAALSVTMAGACEKKGDADDEVDAEYVEEEEPAAAQGGKSFGAARRAADQIEAKGSDRLNAADEAMNAGSN